MLLFYIFVVSVYSCDSTAYNCKIKYFDCVNINKFAYYDYSIDLIRNNITIRNITRKVRESNLLNLCLFTTEYPTCGSLKHTNNYIECYSCTDINSGFSLSPNCNTYIKENQNIQNNIIIGLSTLGAAMLLGLLIFLITLIHFNCKNNMI